MSAITSVALTGNTSTGVMWVNENDRIITVDLLDWLSDPLFISAALTTEDQRR